MKKDHFVYQSGVVNTKAIVHRGTEKSSQDYIKQNAKHFDHKGKNFSVYKGKSNDTSPKKTNFKHVHEGVVMAKTLTPAEKKKREEIAKAMERDNPGMPMDKKMAIATATAKRVEEEMPGNAVGQGGVNMAPNMGPRIKAMNVTDRRRRKDKQPVMLKRFREYMKNA